MDNPYPWLQDFINQVPDWLQPLMIAVAAAIPYVEGEGAATLGIIAGINPIIAALAAIAGNVLCVVLVVLLGSRVRGAVVARRAPRKAGASATATDGATDGAGGSVSTAITTTDDPDGAADAPDAGGKQTRKTKGQAKLRRWLVKFGVPGASLLAPIALPTMLTAAFFVASGVKKEWVILWQVVAIVVWTGAIVAVATGVLALLGW